MRHFWDEGMWDVYVHVYIYIYMPEALNSFVSELHFYCSHLVSSPPVHCHLHRHLSFGHHVAPHLQPGTRFRVLGQNPVGKTILEPG